MSKTKFSKGRVLGNWKLEEKLGGKSGNGDVWSVTSITDQRKGALKLLQRRHRNNDIRKKRFLAEIQIMEKCQDIPGVLKLIDSYSHKVHTETDHIWFVSEIATPLLDHLKDNYALHTVIQACYSFASTLATMHERDISHRDIKPDNLFYRKNSWLIGDFGLVDFPEKAEHTQPTEKIGPIFYLAPEMLNAIGDRDGKKADVWSLAKLLWKLATEQAYPIEGTLSREISPLRLSTYAQGENLSMLDALLEQATQILPENRISMQQFRDELGSWLKLKEEDKLTNSTERKTTVSTKKRIAALYSSAVSERNSQLARKQNLEKRKGRASLLLQEIKTTINGIDENLKEIGFSQDIRKTTTSDNVDVLRAAMKSVGVGYTDHLENSTVGEGRYAFPPIMSTLDLTSLIYCVGLQISSVSDTVAIVYGYFTYHLRRTTPRSEGRRTVVLPIWYQKSEFILDGPRQKQIVSQIPPDLDRELQPAIDAFVDIIKDYEVVRPL